MADLKISQLTGATTPLAGTEVLPIVQSGSTRQVSVANLTAGRTQTSNGIVQGTAGTGYNFTANTPAAGMTSQLLNWYEEGTFTPAVVGSNDAGSGTYTTQTARYTRVGNQVTVIINLAWSAHTGTGSMSVSGLPFTSGSAISSPICVAAYNLSVSAGWYLTGWIKTSSTSIELLQMPTGGGTWALVPMDTSVDSLIITATYFV